MTAPSFSVLHGRMVRDVEPDDRARRIAAVAHRLTPAMCWRCLGEHGIHLATCPRALRSLSVGNARLQFGAAVIRAEQRLRARRVLAELFAQVRSGVAPCDLEEAIAKARGGGSDVPRCASGQPVETCNCRRAGCGGGR